MDQRDRDWTRLLVTEWRPEDRVSQDRSGRYHGISSQALAPTLLLLALFIMSGAR